MVDWIVFIKIDFVVDVEVGVLKVVFWCFNLIVFMFEVGIDLFELDDLMVVDVYDLVCWSFEVWCWFDEEVYWVVVDGYYGYDFNWYDCDICVFCLIFE